MNACALDIRGHNRSMKDVRVWAAFGLLGMFWGSSFLFIVIALRQLQPFTLVALRLGIGTLGLWTILLLSRQKVPRDRETLLSLALLGVFNPALPFLLNLTEYTQYPPFFLPFSPFLEVA